MKIHLGSSGVPNCRNNVNPRHRLPRVTSDVSKVTCDKCLRVAKERAALDEAPAVPYVEVNRETAYGKTSEISRSIRVF